MYCNHLDLLAIRRQQGIEPHPGPEGTTSPISIYDSVFGVAGGSTQSQDAVWPPSSTRVILEVLQVIHFSNHLAQITSREADVFAIGEHTMDEATASSIQSQLTSQYKFSSVFSGLDPELTHKTGYICWLTPH